MEMPLPNMPPSRKLSRKNTHSGFVVKQDNENGTITWINDAMEEITLHQDSAPTVEVLHNLAANGVVPERLTLEKQQEQELFDAPLPDDEPETALSRVLARVKSSPGEVKADVKIYRVKPGNKDIYCATVAVEEYDEGGEEWIRAHFGAGQYRVRVYGPSNNPESGNYGKFVRLTNELVEIEASALPIKGAGGESVAMNPMIDAMMRRMEQFEQRMSGSAVVDPMEQMQKAFGMLRQMGVIGGQQNKSPSISESVKEMVMLQNFVKNLKGDDGNEKPDGLLGALGPLIDIIKPTLEARASMQQALPPTILPPTFAESEIHQPEDENVNAAQTLLLNMMAAGYIAAAAKGDDIEKHAQSLVERIPDEAIDLLEMDIWLDSLCELLPGKAADLRKHSAWMTKLRDRTLALLNEPEPEEPKPVLKPAVAKKVPKS